MVKISLEIKAVLENIDTFRTNHPDYNFILKLKCLNCGEISDKWHLITETETFPLKTGKSEVHFLAKCKLCSRENSLDIVEGSNHEYSTSYNGQFKPIVTFDCRGIEPVDFSAAEGWIAKVEESKKVFENVDLSEKEWVEYDDKANQSVGIYELQHRFVKIK